MKTLQDVRPTPEQLRIISKNKPGVEIIRGAAGSGKTTTALLRLRSLIGIFLSRSRRAGSGEPVNILILTYNRTLRGYVKELAKQQSSDENAFVEVETFARWAVAHMGKINIIEEAERRRVIQDLGSDLPLEGSFILDEVDYVMGRFMPHDLSEYLEVKREGRGISPRVEKSLRKILIDDVIVPYRNYISEKGLWDWNDLSVFFAQNQIDKAYDVIIVDEAQDFSANQIRAVKAQTKELSSLTFVLDTAQRIYARGYRWQEVGITVRPENVQRLTRNYRNTKEVALLAACLVNGLPIDDDATLPDFSKADRNGDMPLVLSGRFGNQMSYVIEYIKKNVDIGEESVAFLHPLGGGWFSEVRKKLEGSGISYVDMTRKSEWPEGNVNVALSTLHSAKGLEFDYVIIIGLNSEVTPHGKDGNDDKLDMLRRLVAMGIGRARKNVILGYKPDSASRLISYLSSDTYVHVEV